jgi:hypothetical protein
MPSKHSYLDEGKIDFPTPFGISEFISFMQYISIEVPCESKYEIDVKINHPLDESNDISECLGKFYRENEQKEIEFFNIGFNSRSKISSIKFCSYNSHSGKYIGTGEPSKLLKLVCEKAHEFIAIS